MGRLGRNHVYPRIFKQTGVTNMKRKYLDDLGIKDRHDLWNPNDNRQSIWQRQRREYGFDERETWSLDSAFYLWLYERLKMYLEYASKIVNLDFHEFVYKGEKYTQKQLINMMIERLENYFANKYDTESEEESSRLDEVAEIWALVLPAMWW